MGIKNDRVKNLHALKALPTKMPLIQCPDSRVVSIDDGYEDALLTEEERETRLLMWFLMAKSNPSITDAAASTESSRSSSSSSSAIGTASTEANSSGSSGSSNSLE